MNHTFRSRAAAVAATLLLSACSGGEDTAPAPDSPAGPAGRAAADSPTDPAATPSPTDTAPDPSSGGWDLQSSGEGVALVYPASGAAAIRLFCPAGASRILVNVPGFRPVGSEERMTFGSGGNAHTLVADTRGDSRRGGVSGTGAVPGNLGALIGGPVSVNYGAQTSGPHPAPPRALVRAFLAGCGFPPPPSPPPPPASSPTGARKEKVGACLMQGDKRLTHPPLRAVGNEPFWGAEIEGRCVTYSHPDNQQGTRVWTRYAPRSGGGGTWTGTLKGRPFVLTTRPVSHCSDGMSDRHYPISVELTVGGEQRRGCAEAG